MSVILYSEQGPKISAAAAAAAAMGGWSFETPISIGYDQNYCVYGKQLPPPKSKPTRRNRKTGKPAYEPTAKPTAKPRATRLPVLQRLNPVRSRHTSATLLAKEPPHLLIERLILLLMIKRIGFIVCFRIDN